MDGWMDGWVDVCMYNLRCPYAFVCVCIHTVCAYSSHKHTNVSARIFACTHLHTASRRGQGQRMRIQIGRQVDGLWWISRYEGDS